MLQENRKIFTHIQVIPKGEKLWESLRVSQQRSLINVLENLKKKNPQPVNKEGKYWKNMYCHIKKLLFDLAKHLNMWRFNENTDTAWYRVGGTG